MGITWKFMGSLLLLGDESKVIGEFHNDRRQSKQEKAANKALILAAPEMREALRVISLCVADEAGGVTLGTHEMDIVRAALAKAQS